MSSKKRTMNFIDLHSIKLIGGINNTELYFIGVTKNFNEVKIQISVSDIDLASMASVILDHHKAIEDESKLRLKHLRKALNYSDSEPEITYKQPRS